MIPSGYLASLARHFDYSKDLEWLSKKYALKQDVFLMSPPPTTISRRLALAFAEMRQLKVEVITLSRDTNEQDLKQRRELTSGRLEFVNQKPVRACLNGSILILDGIEKAERNVLPTLNNLLENREMQLSDGRLIVSHARFNELLGKYSNDYLLKNGIVAAHENFRVIALGTSVPPFKGRFLDPPLRSRFQCRKVGDHRQTVFPPNESADVVQYKKIVYSFNNSLLSLIEEGENNSKNKSIPLFPLSSLNHQIALIEDQGVPIHQVFTQAYPYLNTNFSKAVGKVESANKLFESLREGLFPKMQNNNKNHDDDDKLLQAMKKIKNAKKHVLLFGRPGSGKSYLAKKFLKTELNIDNPLLFPMNKEMTARDLLLTRTIDEATGNTTWMPSELCKAAKEGRPIILDGLHALENSVLTSLSAICEDNVLFLPDENVHARDGFFVIATSNKFENEMMGLFDTIAVDGKAEDQVRSIVRCEEGLAREIMDKVFFVNKLLEKSASEGEVIVDPLSIRQLVKLAKWLSAYSKVEDAASLREMVVPKLFDCTLAWFVPLGKRKRFLEVLTQCDLIRNEQVDVYSLLTSNGQAKTLKPSSRAPPVEKSIGEENKHLVPTGLHYFEIESHSQILDKLSRLFSMQERDLLVIGNQGVGKNKLVDRYLYEARREREYIQLHRDSTIASITVSPALVDGKVIYEDSPLIKAAKFGRVLIIDEGDKAPPEVVSALKSLVTDGVLLLSNGQRLIRDGDVEDARDVLVHPMFSIIVLCNSPNFPFLGNDIFKEVGDAFTTVVIDNPKQEDEVDLLMQIAPSVPRDMVESLVAAFNELRALRKEDVNVYPFSLRELIGIVKHFAAYPDDGLVEALNNVFDFDAYNHSVKKRIEFIFQKHGIPFVFSTINGNVIDHQRVVLGEVSSVTRTTKQKWKNVE